MLKLVKYMRPYAGLIFLIIFFMFGLAIAELYLPIILADMINNGMMSGDAGYVIKKGGSMLIVALIGSCCSIVGAFLSARTAMGFGRDLRNNIFSRVTSCSLEQFDEIGTASLITRTTNDVTQIQATLVMMLRFIVYSPIMCLGGIIMAYSVDPGLCRILLVVLPVMLIFIIAMARLVIPMFAKIQKCVDKLNLILRENLTGVRVIRAFNRQRYEENRFGGANKELTDIAVKVNKIMACMQPIVMMFMNVTAIMIIWFGGVRISEGNIQIGDMIAFLQYAMLIMFSIIMVTMMFVMIPRAQASAVRINEVLMIGVTEERRENGLSPGKGGGVEFRNVTFSYGGATLPALKNISFTAEAGEVTAITGSTGAGKTTLMNMIAGLYEAASGEVIVGGVDVKDQSVGSLRKKLGFVPQTAALFSGTVEDNIKFGKADASATEVKHAAVVAQADAFIAEMAGGYESEIFQGGANLSGGQKQRLQAARALIRKAEINIFDDSFSALDYKTDAMLRNALKSELGASTRIIVSQRIGAIKDADKIVVLNDGVIAGIGTHKELLESCEVYIEIARSQLAPEETADGE